MARLARRAPKKFMSSGSSRRARFDERSEASRTAASGAVCEGSNLYKVYVLRSKVAKKSYVGVTNDLEKRLREHNSGKQYYTRRYMPWEVIYLEDYQDFEEALQREKFLKTTSGRRFLKKVFSALSKKV